MIKSNKFNILLCSAFVCNTQFSNADFNEDWAWVQSEIKNFNESKAYLSEVFKRYEGTGAYRQNVFCTFSNKDIFENTKRNLLQLKSSFNKIDDLLGKILEENITTLEIFDLVLFKFPKIKKELNYVLETIYKTFYLVPCYKTFSLLSMNLDTSLEIVKDKYAKYANAPDQFGIKVYFVNNCSYYIFTDLHDHNKCLFKDKLMSNEYRINVPTLYKEQIGIYDMCCDILSGNVTSGDFGQKLEDCLAYTDEFRHVYFQIPLNQELWPQAITIFINVLKNDAKTEEDFSENLENFLCKFYLGFNDPIRYIVEDFKIKFPSNEFSIKGKFYCNFYMDEIIPIATDSRTIEDFLQSLNKYIIEQKLFNKNNAVRFLMKAMKKANVAMWYNKNYYTIKHNKIKEAGAMTYEMQLVHTPVKLKRSFSQEF